MKKQTSVSCSLNRTVVGTIMGLMSVWFIWMVLQISPSAQAAPTVNAQPTPVFSNILWRGRNGIDSITANSYAEYQTFQTKEGQLYYVPAVSTSQTTPLWRNLAGSDHMDSTACYIGWTCQGPLGYPWNTSAINGVRPLMRWFNTSNGDHMTAQPQETPTGSYTSEGSLQVYGYSRPYLTGESLLYLPADPNATIGGVSIASNGAAGGSLWRWRWGGKDFINIWDLGRQGQSTLFFQNPGAAFNPTEAGDGIGGALTHGISNPQDRWHGSPLFAIGNQPDGFTQVTRAIPLDYAPQDQLDNVRIFRDMVLGKDITLNYETMGPVAHYTTHLTLPSPGLQQAVLEIPSVYLTGDFNRFWTYDARTHALAEVHPTPCSGTPIPQYVPSSGYGGVIISTGDTLYAMGIFGVTRTMGGSVTEFGLWDFTESQCDATNGGTDRYEYRSSKLNAMYGHWTSDVGGSGGLPIVTGETTYDTWLISGTLGDVQAKMNVLCNYQGCAVANNILPPK